jgi:DNA-binding PadR family transcriptional regulator
MTLTEQDLVSLKQLRAAGERGRTIQASHIRVVLDRLAKGGYVAARPTGLELVNYRITQRGQDALVEHDLN